MRKKIFMILMSATLIFTVGCGDKASSKESSVFEPNKVDTIGKKEETKEESKEEIKEETKVETTQTEDLEEPLSNITVDEVKDYIYSNGYDAKYDATTLAEAQIFANMKDSLKDDFYWYDQNKQIEVMVVEYEDGTVSDTLYENYRNFNGSVRAREGEEGSIRYGAVYVPDLQIFIYYAALDNSFVMMSEPYATELSVVNDFSDMLHIDFTISEEDISALESPETVTRIIGDASVSFMFNSMWEVDDSEEDEIYVYVNDDLMMSYSDSWVTVGDEEQLKNSIIGYADVTSFTANGRESYYTCIDDGSGSRLYIIFEDIGVSTYLQIKVLLEDEEIDFEKDILAMVLLNV